MNDEINIYDCHTKELYTQDKELLGWFKFYGSNIEDDYFRMIIKQKHITYVLTKDVKHIENVTFEDLDLFYRLYIYDLRNNKNRRIITELWKCTNNKRCQKDSCDNCEYLKLNHKTLIFNLRCDFSLFNDHISQLFNKLATKYKEL